MRRRSLNGAPHVCCLLRFVYSQVGRSGGFFGRLRAGCGALTVGLIRLIGWFVFVGGEEFFIVGADGVGDGFAGGEGLAVFAEVVHGELQAIEVSAAANGVHAAGGDGVEGGHEGELDGGAVLEHGNDDGAAAAIVLVVEVANGLVEEAIRRAFDGESAAFGAAGQDAAAFFGDFHSDPFGGGPPPSPPGLVQMSDRPRFTFRAARKCSNLRRLGVKIGKPRNLVLGGFLDLRN